ncbi:hypothetical protein N181_03615 [Sinorhizobium fredii USDA 205]|uniref:Uncharacterized protein n=1 Tax=Rhizobium fredii TaxID=380 RepID=A0A844A7C3_RHIFR|nr:hypothetical protein [Sinorhizobium fredii]KSV86121.1 hypothetical protein N181_03615 [Sinorhizobium fredii USDA 205]MQW97821.1 hypothetical protein [Sinorhizobium fredii]MQX07755.1 hypothetical protein [Sinorhizobium fredii]GEC33986.1 hypothetical protein EFR01_41570 [Sinorhizobium fredii]GLS07788.1 hypothetical protein GCM10007864_14150 [Sinorhizobium fredii]
MTNLKNDHLKDHPMPSPTWKPDSKEMPVDPHALPDQAAQPGTDKTHEPPARSGTSERREKPTEPGGKNNPVHHTGRVPPKVTDDER